MLDFSGQRIDKYYLIKRLGKGTFGEVYLAQDPLASTPDAYVAVKILRHRLSSQNMIDFLNEARAFRLKHPNIMPIQDFGVENDIAFLVMDYTPYGTLRQRHPLGTRLSLDTVVSYVKQIAAALQCVHKQDLVHRDVKPENMLVGPNNEILLSDFGLATPSFTRYPAHPQEPLGTLAYIAPEQIQSKAVRASDQYALGAIVYEWLTGVPPFQGTAQEVMLKHLSAPPVPLRNKVRTIPSKVEETVLRTLAKKPTERFDTVQEFANILEKVSGPLPPLDPPLLILKKDITFTGHSDGVRTVAWSPNSRYIASAGGDETVQVWEATTCAPVATYSGHSGEIWSVAWSSTSVYVASAGEDETVQVWEARTGHSLFTYREHIASVRAVVWSPTSMTVASASTDHTVHVWEATTGRTLRTYATHTDTVEAIAWSPNGKYLASGGRDHTVRVWEADTTRYHSIYRGHTDTVTAIAWSPDGTSIASASDDGTVQVWDVETERLRTRYNGHTDPVVAVAWSPDGHYIASGSWDTTVQVWEVSTGRCVQTYRGHSSWVNALSWPANSRYIASGSWDKTVQVWQAL